jgi:hypothetical protein
MSGTVPGACPDAEVYDRLGRLERSGAADRVRREHNDRSIDDLRRDVDRVVEGMTRLSTTIKVATAILGFIVALAGVVVPLWKS